MMTTTIRAVLAALALSACAPPAVTQAQTEAHGDSLFVGAPSQRWALPARLREISGIAVALDGRVFAHDDETAIIYEIDPTRGALVSNFALGDPIETGDFEGLAIAPDGTFWLTTATGQLYRFRAGADGAHVAFERFDTGLADICEIEGLAYFAAEESLILACKRNQARAMRDMILLYAWRPGASARQWLAVPEGVLTEAAGVRRFAPSSVEIEPESGRVLLLSASDPALVELDRDGQLLAARALHGHAQAESVTVAGGALIIGDEGPRTPPQLSRYERSP